MSPTTNVFSSLLRSVASLCPALSLLVVACGGDPVPTDAGLDAPPVTDTPLPDVGPTDAGETLPSAGCDGSPMYPAGTTTVGELDHDAVTRSFRVHVPPGYTGSDAVPVVLMFHGGGGSARQFEERSSNMSPIADREGFIAVYPDGTGTLGTWNGGGCCGSAVTNDVDDVGFVAALLDHLEATMCLDRRRIYASGMSNGGIMSHRLACELSERFAAVAPVASAEMSPTCAPSVAVPTLHIHGSEDGHVPVAGGVGCGPSGADFPPQADWLAERRAINGCDATSTETLTMGDGTCQTFDGCQAEVTLCTIEGGGHSWPGGAPNAGVVDCPADGAQSTTFFASEVMWTFFERHAIPLDL